MNFKKLGWAIPTILIVSATNWALREGVALPLPFILILASVLFAGCFGGLLLGALTGLIASAQILYFHAIGAGPQELTGTLLNAVLGSMVFTGIGIQLGYQSDKTGKLVDDLLRTKRQLKKSVETTKIERDIEAEKVAERDEQLDQAMRLSGVGLFRFNALTGDCEFCSDAHAAQYGITPEEFQTLTRGPDPYVGFVIEEDRETFRQAVARIDYGEALPFDYRILRTDGEIRHIRQINEPIYDDDGRFVAVVGSSIDFTELHEAQERVRRSQRIEVIGNLTGGVAHDFNNLLAIILGNLELSLLVEDPTERRTLTQEAIKATNRGADLTKNLLSFAGQAHLTPTRLNLNQLIDNTVNWSSRILPTSLNIETSLAAGLWDTELDAASAESALINLLLNARDAMPDGGKLTIETANMRMVSEFIGDHPDPIEPGRYVMLAISDTGHGIAADKLEQVFEPFYTGKPLGEGTGLGLSMVQGFIKQSEGAIRLSSEVGVGTTFKLYLKAAGQKPEPVHAVQPTDRVLSQDSKRILLAEDEKDLAKVLESILKSAGHVVTSASNGDEALKKYKTSGPFDIILTDIVMPGTLQGPSLAKEIRQISPDMNFIFISGYAAEEAVHGTGFDDSDIRLMKPVSHDQLLTAITDVGGTSADKKPKPDARLS